MRRAVGFALGAGIVVAWLATSLETTAAPGKAPPPLPPLPMLPTVARVTLTVLGPQVLVTTDVNLPRGDWSGDALDFYVAFGSPGVPRAVDVHLVPVPDGALEADAAAVGETLTTDRAPRRPHGAYPLLGRDTMAGLVVHVRREAFARALTPGNMAALRIRSALDVPPEEPGGGRSVVARLGASRGTPLTLAAIAVLGGPNGPVVSRAEARLCGPDAEPHLLAVSLASRGPRAAEGAPIAPVLAVRHATDDLCIRFWE